MNRNKFYVAIIFALLASNILMFFLQKNKGFDPDRPRNTVIKKLGFDDEQIKQYDRLIAQHRKVIKEHNEEIFSQKKALYSKYLMVENSLAKDSLINNIATAQKEIEMIHFDHFVDIKNICRKDQLEKCSDLFKEITDVFPQKNQRK